MMSAACSGSYKGGTSSEDSGLRPGDVIEIEFQRYTDFDQTVIVHPDGKIALLAVADLAVLNVTKLELTRILHLKYAALLDNPQVSVEIVKASNFQIYMGGNLQRPGVVKFKGNLSIAQGIQLAGGLKDPSSDYKVVVFRKQGKSGMKVHKFELKSEIRIDNSLANFILAPYDVVFVVRFVLSNTDQKTLI